MIKIPQTQYPVNKELVNRWSPRAFRDARISEEQLMTLFEAAQWAPSSMNEQPWRYMYAHRGTPEFDAMHDCLLDGNKPWTLQASVLVLCVAEKTFERNGNANRHAFHDVGMANANLFVQATSMGIFGHILGGYNFEKTARVFNLNEAQEAVCFLALGFLGDANQLDEPFKTRELTPRSRKPLELIATPFLL